MYYAHFGLKQPPFKITPNTEFFFSGGNRGAVLDALVYAITSGEGIVKVVGEVGSGKTMLCRMLQTLLPQNVESVYLANPSVAPEDILHAIAFELHLPLPADADRLQVMQALQKFLLERHAENRRVVIFIEEAQGMPLATLEEIRLLTNLETNHDKLLQIVLFGQPELDENLNASQIRQLRERITHSFDLGPLAADEIGDYLVSRLRTAGYFGPPLFTKGAIRKIAAASKGLVRRINILADKALLAAFAENVYAVTPRHVTVAVRDSAFGTEQVKFVPNARAFAAVLILLAGLTAGFGLHAVTRPELQQSTSSRVTAIVAEPAAIPGRVQVSQAVQNVADILDQRLQLTQPWLAAQPASTVSIQLMGTEQPEQLRLELKNLAGMLELDNIHVYSTKVQGKPFMSVLYGQYPDREAATKALLSLPQTLRAHQPQLRTVGGILDEIKRRQ